MMQKLITMSETEIARYDIIKKLLDKRFKNSQAAKLLDLSVRQIKRLKKAVREKGAAGLIHKNRGRESNRKINSEIIAKAEKYLKEKYSDFGPTFAAEKLEANHQIKLSDEKVRQMMSSINLWKTKSRKSIGEYHGWRARKECFGEMEQFDGSYHKWLEDRNDEMCLLLSIDDANGQITHAKFDKNEGIAAVFKFWLEYFDKNGLPASVYLDKFSTYKINHPSAVDNKELMTQFQRAMDQVDAMLISAHSPEAKGRVERVFKTLQDRLVKELRLAGISTIEEANEFLKEYIPKFNEQFSVAPRSRNNLHKELKKDLKEKLPQIFSVQSPRIVNNDYTIMFKTRFFQLAEVQPATVYKKDAVIIEEHLGGEIKIGFNGHYLNYQELPERPKKQNIPLPALTR
ncbi:ISNCY family transposase, partial [Patescibacteria group bacterium]|nr:ISNCY family transposase [Patescibacteria group bacterium]